MPEEDGFCWLYRRTSFRTGRWKAPMEPEVEGVEGEEVRDPRKMRVNCLRYDIVQIHSADRRR